MYTIMIVDDEILEVEALEMIISKEFSVFKNIITASNGKDAILKAKQHKPDIILMDISLPEIDGFSAQEKIISILPNTSTIMLTAHSSFDYVQKAMRLKAKDYLLKPVRTNDLKSSIKKILGELKANNNHAEEFLYLNRSKSDIIRNTIVYMNNNYKNKIDLNSIANEIHVNPQYLSRVFKKEIGMGCTDYINLLRVNQAREMLVETSYPAYRIACDAGFSDSAYFSRVFTKHVNLTPSEYRKSFLR